MPIYQSAPIGANQNEIVLINLNQLPYAAVMISYVSTVAGTGTCDVYIAARQIGG